MIYTSDGNLLLDKNIGNCTGTRFWTCPVFTAQPRYLLRSLKTLSSFITNENLNLKKVLLLKNSKDNLAIFFLKLDNWENLEWDKSEIECKFFPIENLLQFEFVVDDISGKRERIYSMFSYTIRIPQVWSELIRIDSEAQINRKAQLIKSVQFDSWEEDLSTELEAWNLEVNSN